MARLVECVPNFSEGKNKTIVDKIALEAKNTPGVKLLDVQMDADHNRCVITFIGEPEAAANAAFRMCKVASENIDMNHHKGEHPRLGATDVIPFIPISEVSTEETAQLAVKLGERIWDELKIPVYLYEDAARNEERRDISNIRHGEYEAIKKEMGIKPERNPDIGLPIIHPTAGAVVVGARMPLVAFNVNLGTKNIEIAREIAKLIRFRSGGLRFVKALGFSIHGRGYVQVSMNLTNYKKTSIRTAFEFVKREAERLGVLPIGAEIVGLLPLEAIVDVAVTHMNVWDFKKAQIIDLRIGTSDAGEVSWLPKAFINEVASKSPAPGGGSVAASAGALGAALSAMVAKLSQGKKYVDVKDLMIETADKADKLGEKLKNLIQEDSNAFNEMLACRKLPSGTPESDSFKKSKIQESVIRATKIPLQTMIVAAEVLPLLQIVVEKGNQNSISDAGVASLSVKTAILGAHMNVMINLPSIEDKNLVESLAKEAEQIEKKALIEADAIFEKVRQIIRDIKI